MWLLIVVKQFKWRFLSRWSAWYYDAVKNSLPYTIFTTTKHPFVFKSLSHFSSLSTGYLSVCLSGSWKERWCVVRGGTLYLHKNPGDQRPPVIVVPLKAAEVVPGGLGPKHPFSFRILQGGNELASLEVLHCGIKGSWTISIGRGNLM